MCCPNSCEQHDIWNEPGPSNQRFKYLPTEVTTQVLDSLLVNNEKGKIITNYYAKHGMLDLEHRKNLAHVIVDRYIANNQYFSLADMKAFSEIISEKFTDEFAELYYSPRNKDAGKKNPSGLLYDRFHNRNKKDSLKRKRDLRAQNHDCLQAVKKQVFALTDTELACFGTEKNWLRNNIAPSEEVMRCWNDTFFIRFKDILADTTPDRHQIIEQWPRFNDPEGYLLVDSDFAALFGEDKSSCFFNEWDKFSNDFEVYLKQSQIKEKVSLALSKELDSKDLQRDYRYYIISVLFHSIIKPVRISENKLPTIAQAQSDVCMACDSEDEYVNAVKAIRDDYNIARRPLFPRIFIIRDKSQLTKFYVTWR
ncbi:uncharacterized protein LOC131680809 [Topomyia yanbarensis]|uniref:uncharacterized protein LOC131680809 n=1 Tax=Topomyia yanbarensis TaxID=2498891 RepID=UPI00273C8182|nr:uncharacterized protein LOC131680809 [Topomyia yanbarensis]